MVFLGLLLAVAALAAGAGIVLDNDAAATLTVFGQTVPGVSGQWQVFLAGAVVAVIFMLGMMLAFLGFGRLLRNRRDLRYLREEHEESMTTLQMEKRELQRELDRIRRTNDAGLPARTRVQQPAPDAPGPGAVQPGAVQPGAARPGAVQSNVARSGAGRPGAVQPGAARSGAPQHGPSRQTPLAGAAARTGFFDRTD